MTPEEFAAASKKATSEDIKYGGIWLGVMALGYLVTTILFGRLPAPLTTANALLSLMCFVILSTPWIFIILRIRQHAKRRSLQCPHCEKPFLAQDRKIVLSGGACCHCGKPVIARTHS